MIGHLFSAGAMGDRGVKAGARVIRLWHRMMLAVLILVAVRSGWGDERIVFSGFGFAEHVITPAPFLLAFSNRPADRQAQLIGVGWYEYALVTGEQVEFVAEERGAIFERRASSYAASRLCDLSEAVYAGAGHPIAMPDLRRRMPPQGGVTARGAGAGRRTRSAPAARSRHRHP
jgi:hypothetical protein